MIDIGDGEQAAKYYKMAADQVLAVAQFEYGRCLRDEIGVAFSGIRERLPNTAKSRRIKGQSNYEFCWNVHGFPFTE
jgi:hypothetical protein